MATVAEKLTHRPRPSYRYGVEWLARNDDAMETDRSAIAGLVTTCLLADLFDKNPLDVADAVLRKRAAIAKAEGRADG